MILRVHREDWFKNAGIVGFVNIIGKDKLNIKDDYIEFDHSILENFEDAYFKYFMDKYDIFKKTNSIITTLLKSIDKNEKPKKDKLDKISKTLSAQVTKLKKIDIDLYNELNSLVNSISKSKDYDELESKALQVLGSLKEQRINDKLTCNKFKSILQNNFFGQVSFLNSSKSNDNYGLQELKDILVKDYLFEINYYCRLIDLFNESYNQLNLDAFLKFIELEISPSEESTLREGFNNKKIKEDSYKKFKKLLKNIRSTSTSKGASFEDIKLYLESLDKCELCDTIHECIGEPFSESMFGSLGISPENAMNFYWNQNISKQICPVCKLILFCIPAGVTEVKKNFLDDADTTRYLFFNEEGTVEDIIVSNNSLNIKTSSKNLPTDFMLDSISTLRNKSIWQIKNKFFIEFISSVGSKKKNKVSYFNIPTHIAKFFADEANVKLLNSIKNDLFKYEIIDNLLNNRNINTPIIKKLYAKLTKEDTLTPILDCYSAVKISAKIIDNKGASNLEDKLKTMHDTGYHIRQVLIKQGNENKITSLGFKLLRATRSGDRIKLGENLLKIVMSIDIPLTKSFKNNFLDLLNSDKKADFEPLCLALICGLIAIPYEKGEVE